MTRPDLIWPYYEVGKNVQFPDIAHMEAAEHVPQYLRDTWNESITYTRGSRNPYEIWGWFHVNWAGNTDSHTGYILMMNSGPISEKSVCVVLFYSTDIGESFCTVLGLHRDRAKGDAPTIQDRRRPNLTLSPLK